MPRQGGGSDNRLSDWRRVTGAAAASGLAASAEEGGAAEEREGDGFGSGEDDFAVNTPGRGAGGARWAERRAAAGGSNIGGRGGRRKGGGGGGSGSRATRRAGGCVTLRGETETGGGHYAREATSRFGASNDGAPAARGSLSEPALKTATSESYQNREQGQSEIDVLRDMFGCGALSDAEISHVYYHECRGSLEASIEALLRLANRVDSTRCDSIGSEGTERQHSAVSLDPHPASPSSSFAFPSASPSAFPSDSASASAITPPAAPPLVRPSASSSPPPLPPLAVPPSSSSAHPSSAHPYPLPSSPALTSPPGGAPLLVALPCDLQDLILSALDLPSLARLACASRHLRHLIRLRRLALKHLALPRTLPAWAAPLLVGAHGGLEWLSLQRLGRCEMDFRAVFAAAAGVGERGEQGGEVGGGETGGVWGAEAGRERGGVGKQRQVQLQQVVVGGVVMQPTRSLQSISLAGCVHLSDADVASLCTLHRRLASVDLSSCRQVTDVALTWLGQHEREAGAEEESNGMTVKGEEQDRVATEPTAVTAAAAAASDGTGTASAAREQQGRRQTVTSQHLSAALNAALSSCSLTHSSTTTTSSSFNPRSSHSSQPPRGLTSINISDCPLITNRGLQTLLRAPPIAASLVSLDISCCSLISSPGLNLPHSLSALRHLSASHLPLLESLTLLPLSCPLEEISFSCCPVLQKLTIHSRSLRSLNLAGCRKLSSLSLICPALSSLILSQCSSLETFSPADRCPSLASLNSFLCRSLPAATLTTLLTHAKDLEELNCGGCALLETVRLPPVTHGRLRRVLLEGCPVLSSVVVPAASLLLLDCRGCTQLREVRVLEHPAVAAEAAAADTAAAAAAAGVANATATASAVAPSPSSALPTAAAAAGSGCSLGRVLLTNCSSLHTLLLPFSSIRQSILAAAANSKSHTTTTSSSTSSSSFGCTSSGTSSGSRGNGGQEGAWRDVGSGSGVCSGDGGLARASGGGRGGERGGAGVVFEASVSGCTLLPRETQRALRSLCKLARADVYLT
ncbi:unnamed protein product [Closterium sp. NIES-54]